MASVSLLCLAIVSGSKSWHHDVCHSVSVVTSLSCAVGEGLHAVVWPRGLEAPVEDNWCMPCAGGSSECDGLWHRSSVLSEAVTCFAAVGAAGAHTPYQCSAHSLLQTWISGALLRITVVVLWHTFPCERLSPALVFHSCSPLLFSPLFPFSCLS